MTILHVQQKHLAPLLAVLAWGRCYPDKLAKELGIAESTLGYVIRYAREMGHNIQTRNSGSGAYYVLIPDAFTDTDASAAEEADRYKRRNEELT